MGRTKSRQRGETTIGFLHVEREKRQERLSVLPMLIPHTRFIALQSHYSGIRLAPPLAAFEKRGNCARIPSSPDRVPRAPASGLAFAAPLLNSYDKEPRINIIINCSISYYSVILDVPPDDPRPTYRQEGLRSFLLEEASDESLLYALVTGAAWAMDTLYQRYSHLLYVLAYRWVGNHQAAEDIVQETFLKLWHHCGTYNAQAGSVRSWLLALLHHNAIDSRRKTRSRWDKELPWDEAVEDMEATETDVWEEVWHTILREALQHLPREQGVVIALAYVVGWTHEEIARYCQLPIGTVKSRLRLGRQHLRHLLGPHIEEERSLGTAPNRERVPSRIPVTVCIRHKEAGCPTGYEVCQDGLCTCFGYGMWELLIEQIEAFEFVGKTGKLRACKERHSRGHAYWYAFPLQGMHRQKVYLGRSSDLKLMHLETVAQRVSHMKKQ